MYDFNRVSFYHRGQRLQKAGCSISHIDFALCFFIDIPYFTCGSCLCIAFSVFKNLLNLKNAPYLKQEQIFLARIKQEMWVPSIRSYVTLSVGCIII